VRYGNEISNTFFPRFTIEKMTERGRAEIEISLSAMGE
jgi:hypothetical protein